jgi:MFS family permease
MSAVQKGRQMTVLPPALLLAGIVSMTPSSSALPGQSTIQQLTNGLGWWALAASLVGLVLGAAAWALGSHTNNYQYANAGRKAVLASGVAALLIGAAPTVVNFLFQTGHGIH